MMIINYKMKGLIYCLYYPHDENEQVYIGSTTKDLEERRRKLIIDYGCWTRGVRKGKNTSFILIEKYGEDNIKIKLLEEKEINDKHELRQLQTKWIERTNSINMVKPSRTNQEWTEDKKEHLKEYRREYFSRPDVKERQKKNRKKYLKTHRDKVTQQQADYRIRKATNCPKCGKYVLGGCMKRHDRYNH